jgi:hypothetical protein
VRERERRVFKGGEKEVCVCACISLSCACNISLSCISNSNILFSSSHSSFSILFPKSLSLGILFFSFWYPLFFSFFLIFSRSCAYPSTHAHTLYISTFLFLSSSHFFIFSFMFFLSTHFTLSNYGKERKGFFFFCKE